jgi:hypothetical protein
MNLQTLKDITYTADLHKLNKHFTVFVDTDGMAELEKSFKELKELGVSFYGSLSEGQQLATMNIKYAGYYISIIQIQKINQQ